MQRSKAVETVNSKDELNLEQDKLSRVGKWSACNNLENVTRETEKTSVLGERALREKWESACGVERYKVLLGTTKHQDYYSLQPENMVSELFYTLIDCEEVSFGACLRRYGALTILIQSLGVNIK